MTSLPAAQDSLSALMMTRRPAWAFSRSTAENTLRQHFGTVSLEGFGFSETDGAALVAAGAVLDYLRETQKSSLAHIDRLTPFGTTSTAIVLSTPVSGRTITLPAAVPRPRDHAHHHRR